MNDNGSRLSGGRRLPLEIRAAIRGEGIGETRIANSLNSNTPGAIRCVAYPGPL